MADSKLPATSQLLVPSLDYFNADPLHAAFSRATTWPSPLGGFATPGASPSIHHQR
jgi:hypothetical protein